MALPFAAYTDPGLFERERERIFHADWIPDLRGSQRWWIPGATLALDLAGEPVVVLRGADGELRALSNACRHRGTPIVGSRLPEGRS